MKTPPEKNFARTDANRDPISSEPGAHLIGTGPGEAFNASVHDVYWREAHTREPYYQSGHTYDDYAPGYRTGFEAAGQQLGQNRRFEDLEPELRTQYERIKGKSQLAWEDAKQAARAAWDRVEQVMQGGLDNDGR